MRLTFWGVRGSIATSGPKVARVGGNTTCLEVVCGRERLILDGGTGLRPLGEQLVAEGRALERPVRAALMFTHHHWDHIQGFPFFSPAFDPTSELQFYGPADATGERTLEDVLAAQMMPPNFPVPMTSMRSQRSFHTIRSGDSWSVGPFDVRVRALKHPQGVLGYRIEANGRALCFATDTEHPEDGSVEEAILDLAQGVDLLVYDAQYTPAEYEGRQGPCRRGWGHSTYVAAVEAARASGAARLALFHHDPSHDDALVDAIEAEAQALFPEAFAAREGLTVEV